MIYNCECRREPDGSEYTCKFCEERWDTEDEIPPALRLKAVQSEHGTRTGEKKNG